MYSYSRLRPVLIAALLGCIAPRFDVASAQERCVPAGPRRTEGGAVGGSPGRGPNASGADLASFNSGGSALLAAPSLSLAPHHEGMRIPSAFDAAVSYTTPAYVSRDVPRSVTLHYSSGQAAPRGFVQVDATDNSTTAPDRMSIRLLDPSGARVTFTNGTQEIFYRAGAGATRLAAQFDASQLGTGAYGYTVVVRSWWGGCYDEAKAPVRVLIVNERTSPFGLGWSMPGLQRLRDQGDGVFIAAGDGSAVWFTKNATGGYDAPAGDFTEVRWDADSTVWIRSYPDGTEVRFGADGRMLDVADRLGNSTVYGYDTSDRLTSITDPVGKQTTLDYTGSGALAWVQDPGERRVVTTASGNILYQFQDPDGVVALDLEFSGERLLGYWERGVSRSEGESARWHFDYDAHGALAQVVAPQVSTTDAGLYHVRARWYDPELERFISEDPIGLAGGINPYVFAGNDPVNRRDPRLKNDQPALHQAPLSPCSRWDDRSGVERADRMRSGTSPGGAG
jgi:RHS repeat-associated protein